MDDGTRQPLSNAEKSCELHLTHLQKPSRLRATVVVSRSCSAMTWSVGKAKFNDSSLQAYKPMITYERERESL